MRSDQVRVLPDRGGQITEDDPPFPEPDQLAAKAPRRLSLGHDPGGRSFIARVIPPVLDRRSVRYNPVVGIVLTRPTRRDGNPGNRHRCLDPRLTATGRCRRPKSSDCGQATVEQPGRFAPFGRQPPDEVLVDRDLGFAGRLGTHAVMVTSRFDPRRQARFGPRPGRNHGCSGSVRPDMALFDPTAQPMPEPLVHYWSMWNEPDVDRIRTHLDRAVAEGVVWADPRDFHTGRDALEANVRALRTAKPDYRFAIGSEVDGHNRRFRYRWHMMRRHRILLRGLDIVTIDDGGLIERVDGFFGEPLAIEASGSGVPERFHPSRQQR